MLSHSSQVMFFRSVGDVKGDVIEHYILSPETGRGGVGH